MSSFEELERSEWELHNALKDYVDRVGLKLTLISVNEFLADWLAGSEWKEMDDDGNDR